MNEVAVEVASVNQVTWVIIGTKKARQSLAREGLVCQDALAGNIGLSVRAPAPRKVGPVPASALVFAPLWRGW